MTDSLLEQDSGLTGEGEVDARLLAEDGALVSYQSLVFNKMLQYLVLSHPFHLLLF